MRTLRSTLALFRVGVSPYLDADPSPRLGRYSMPARSALLALALTLAVSTVAQAQDEEVTLGDKVRVSTEDDGAWTAGQLVGLEGDTLSIAKGVEELHYRLGEIQQAERWEPRNPAWTLIGTTAGGTVGMLSSGLFGDTDDCAFDGPDCPWITGSAGGDAAVGAGLGLVGGLVVWAVDQGDWKKWEIPAP